jgi:cardiolipin synthase
VRAALVLRDNLRHRHSIERAYRAALRTARREVVVACAYFLPGKRMRRALLDAAARGARVHLLLQGRADHRIQHFAQRSLYGQLLAGGVAISEYQASFLHAKVAVVDAHWATVGSSNIDPFSLLLAREANLVVRDADFCRDLGQRLAQASAAGAVAVDPLRYARRPPWERARDWLAYAFVRAATLVLANVRDY